MHIILIGNYPLDKQESMERFTLMLQGGFEKAGFQTEIWRPEAFFGARFSSTTSGLGKWMGYIDKWIIFPFVLRFKVKKLKNKNVRFHICDHSNSPYLGHLPVESTAITCHDVLAIRGAMGFADAYCTASGPGKLLQKWILYHLSKANNLAAVSNFTLNQLKDLNKGKSQNQQNWKVIYNAFNDDFGRLNTDTVKKLLKDAGLNPNKRFILHVGSNLPRKNRGLLLEMVKELGDKWNGKIYFAGQPINEPLLANAKKLGIEDRIVNVVNPNHKLLVALYSACEAFIFPSFSEGFGWPIIEAQACGAPVLTSNVGALQEVGGGTALHLNPNNSKEFSKALLTLSDDKVQNNIVEKGFENINRFKFEQMMNAYLDLHQINRTILVN